MVIAFWSYCYVLFAWNNCWSPLQIKLSSILAVKWIFFQKSITEHYHYTSMADVIKLCFCVCWHVMLLMCCRLLELEVFNCDGMTDRRLLEGIGSLHGLTSLRRNSTTQTWSTFLLYVPLNHMKMPKDALHCVWVDDLQNLKLFQRYITHITSVWSLSRMYGTMNF